MNLKTVENIKQVNFKLQSLPYLKSLQLFIRVENDRAENKGSSQLDSIEFDLNKCPNLEVLDLHFSGIPFETDMLKTSQLNSLKILKLALHMNKHAKKQCMDFSCLKDCSSLEVIHLYFASGCVANLTWLKNLKNLREIKLFMGYSGKWSVDAKFFLPLTECKELRVLHIQNIHVKDNVKFYELLKFFPCLEELLLGEEVVDEYIGMNKHKKKLRENYLIKKEDCRISSKGKVTGFYY
jgi:hypothetical protein